MSAVHFDRDGSGLSPRCGHPGWSRITAAEGDVTCRTCLNLLAGTHAVGNRWFDARSCGSEAAARRHQRHGEKVDEACRLAANRKATDRRARRRRNRKALAA